MNPDERRKYHREWYARNIEANRKKSRENARKHRALHPKSWNSPARALWLAKHRNTRLRDQRLMRLYHITAAKYDAMLAAQGGVCNICGEPQGFGKRRLSVDHDRSCCGGSVSCGACVRQILCVKCNAGLGNFRDNPALLRKAAEVLEGYNEVVSDIHVTLTSRKGKEG
jgi:hypothetical protein